MEDLFGTSKLCLMGGGPPLYGSLGGWILMNYRKVKGGKVLPGALGMSSSVNRWRTWQRAVDSVTGLGLLR